MRLQEGEYMENGCGTKYHPIGFQTGTHTVGYDEIYPIRSIFIRSDRRFSSSVNRP